MKWERPLKKDGGHNAECQRDCLEAGRPPIEWGLSQGGCADQPILQHFAPRLTIPIPLAPGPTSDGCHSAWGKATWRAIPG